MSLTASSKGGGDFQLAPVGNHIARCVQVIDLGTQRDSFEGKPKIMHKVRISWELPEEKAVFDEEKGEEPFLVSKEYTLSLSDRANLRHDLESWRGRDFTEKELEAFDIDKLLGAPCMLNVIHKKSAKKRDYVAITSVTRLPKSVKPKDVPKQILPSVKYMIEDGRNDVFKALPDFIKAKIMVSEEWTGEKSAPSDDTPGEDAPSDDAPRTDEPF